MGSASSNQVPPCFAGIVASLGALLNRIRISDIRHRRGRKREGPLDELCDDVLNFAAVLGKFVIIDYRA